MRRPVGQVVKLLLYVSVCLLALLSCEHNQPDDQPQDEASSHYYDELGLSRYDPVITLSFTGEDSVFIEEITNIHPEETLTSNRWTHLYEDVLGIRIVYDWIEKGDTYRQKLGIAISSGDIPDVVRVNPSQLRMLSNAGHIQDLTEAFNLYATDLTREILTQEGLGPFQAATIDGKLMGIPQNDSSIDKASVIWIRTDWLEKLGLEPPHTMDDLLAISRAFAEQDPDRNGLHDTYGIAATNYLWDPVAGLHGFMAGYGAYPQLWIEDSSGRLVYGGIQPEVKKALAVLQELYRQGHIDPDFAIKKGEQVRNDIWEGKVGIMYGEQWGSFHVGGSRNSDDDADWQAYPIVSAVGNQPMVPLQFITTGYFAVRSGCEHPEALVKLFNLHLEKNWGDTAEYDKYYNDAAAVWQLSPVKPFPPKKNLDAYRQLAEFERTGNDEQMGDEAKTIWKYIQSWRNEGQAGGWGWERIYGPQGSYSIIDGYDRNGQLLYDKFTGFPTPTMIDRESFLHDLQNEVFINIILGSPLEEFDRFVEQWRLLGGDRITQEVNEWYHSQK